MRRPVQHQEYKELIRLQDLYLEILVDELSEIVGEGLAGGWLSKRSKEIGDLRAQIQAAKKNLRIPIWHRRQRDAALIC